jgi:pimeloyl-ACP methyl ester carboxylesterase
MQTSIGRCVAANFLAWGAVLAPLAVPQARAETESAALRCQRLDATALTDSAFDDSPTFLDAASDAKSTVRFPMHCIVRGTIEKRIGVGGVQFGSKFELRMPVAWNGRFMFQGGGGTDGAVLPAYGDRNQPIGNIPALAQGFAVVTTDGGHEDNDASFGLDPKARIDWGYHSVVVVTRAAKQLVSQFYGRAPDYSYLVGCSNGGRQGMMMSQRFPEEYDGIVAGDPVFRLSASHVASAWDIQTFTAIAPVGADGKPVLSRTFSDVDLKLLSDAILEDCDALDGVKDGLVSDPNACRSIPGGWHAPAIRPTAVFCRRRLRLCGAISAGQKIARGARSIRTGRGTLPLRLPAGALGSSAHRRRRSRTRSRRV